MCAERLKHTTRRARQRTQLTTTARRARVQHPAVTKRVRRVTELTRQMAGMADPMGAGTRLPCCARPSAATARPVVPQPRLGSTGGGEPLGAACEAAGPTCVICRLSWLPRMRVMRSGYRTWRGQGKAASTQHWCGWVGWRPMRPPKSWFTAIHFTLGGTNSSLPARSRQQEPPRRTRAPASTPAVPWYTQHHRSNP
jgi:hypothetical protein